jgi:hypothetical protein
MTVLGLIMLVSMASGVVWLVLYLISKDDVPKLKNEVPLWARHPKPVKKVEVPKVNKIVLSDGLKKISDGGEIDQPFEKLRKEIEGEE